ncbi:succinate-semialdehyde dehydrogenase (NADP(+)) [Actinotalea ferrariae]|uniref:succinic semialdehyde dehydrogenase n=1 Tax=Actinotalea ferrariae TaxID=1386098 RepID=UPI001C8B94DC|nr:succinic semialdehyde dehydrogenase [Actinotalea ferrariae]MBX9247130.1 succinate-semialdehyde dehydrogenase (NADP(+)) [Actinotalea ferrariae]
MRDADVVDPETDPTATWALEPEQVRRLTSRLVAAGPSSLTHSPLTGAPLAEVPASTADDVVRAAALARGAQRAWARTPVDRRAAVLLRLHDLVLDRQSEVLDLVQLENGKARSSAYEEVADVALLARHYGRRAPAYLAPRRVPGLLPGLTAVRVLRHPVGLVGVVAPFNYPLNLSIGDALPALVAGNGVVIKPDPQTTLTALWAVALAEEAGLPVGLVQVVAGGAEVGSALIEAVDHVVFTGSTATGRRVAAQAGHALVGATLELGGKNALYVTDDVDLAVTAEGVVRACFSNTGQLCVSMERLLVHEAVADAFLAELLPRVRALRLGAGLDYTADVGSLTSAAQLERVQRHVEDAIGRGAVVLAGGVHRPDVGPFFYEPTVLDRVPQEAAVAGEETFGPVVSVQRVRDDEHAIALANDSEMGLAASVWCRDLRRAGAVAERLEVGAVGINDGYAAAWGSTGAPIGGVKASGLGRRHGAEGIHAVTRTQTVATQRGAHQGLGLGRLYALPAERWTEAFTAGLRLARRVGLR